MADAKEILNCSLCDKGSFKFYVTFCRSHPDLPLVVSTSHKPEFSEEEKELIQKIFHGREIRWEQRTIKNHAHCHIGLKIF